MLTNFILLLNQFHWVICWLYQHVWAKEVLLWSEYIICQGGLSSIPSHGSAPVSLLLFIWSPFQFWNNLFIALDDLKVVMHDPHTTTLACSNLSSLMFNLYSCIQHKETSQNFNHFKSKDVRMMPVSCPCGHLVPSPDPYSSNNLCRMTMIALMLSLAICNAVLAAIKISCLDPGNVLH